MNWDSDIVNLLFLMVGAGFAITVKKRRFDRTSDLGVERFSSFWAKLGSKSGDLVLIGTAICFLGLGTILLSANHLDTWGWLLIAPVCLFLLYLLLGF